MKAGQSHCFFFSKTENPHMRWGETWLNTMVFAGESHEKKKKKKKAASWLRPQRCVYSTTGSRRNAWLSRHFLGRRSDSSLRLFRWKDAGDLRKPSGFQHARTQPTGQKERPVFFFYFFFFKDSKQRSYSGTSFLSATGSSCYCMKLPSYLARRRTKKVTFLLSNSCSC